MTTTSRMLLWSTRLFFILVVCTIIECRTCSFVRPLGDTHSSSNVGVVGTLASSCGFEQSSSASDVISATKRQLKITFQNNRGRTGTQGDVRVGKESSPRKLRQMAEFNITAHRFLVSLFGVKGFWWFWQWLTYYYKEADICIECIKSTVRTLKAGSGLRVCCPTALHEAHETWTGWRSTAWNSTQVWPHPLHYLHHDLKDVIFP